MADSGDTDCLTAYTGLEAVLALEILPDAFLYGSFSGLIKGYSLQTGAHIIEFAGHTDAVRQLKASIGGDDGKLFSCSSDGTVRSWDLKKANCLRVFKGHTGAVGALAYQDGEGGKPSILLSGGDDGAIRSWEIASGKCLRSIRIHIGRINSIFYSNGRVYTCGIDGLCKCVDLENCSLLTIYEGLSPVRCLRLYVPTVPSGDAAGATTAAPQNPWLIAGCTDKRIRIYDANTALCIQTLEGHKEVIFTLAICGNILFSGSDDGSIKQWRLDNGKCEYTYLGHADAVFCLCITPNNELYSGSFDQSVRTWDVDGVRDKIRIRTLLDDRSLKEVRSTIANRGPKVIPTKEGTGAKKGGQRPSTAPQPKSKTTATPGRPATAKGGKNAQSDAVATKKLRDKWEKEILELARGNLSSVHGIFVKYVKDNGTLTFEDFRRALLLLNVNQQPLIEKMWSVFEPHKIEQTIQYKKFFTELHRITNGPDKEIAFRMCFNLYDLAKKGELLKADIERPLNPDHPARFGRNPAQVAAMMEVLGDFDEVNPKTFEEFATAMAAESRMISAFLSTLLVNVSGMNL